MDDTLDIDFNEEDFDEDTWLYKSEDDMLRASSEEDEVNLLGSESTPQKMGKERWIPAMLEDNDSTASLSILVSEDFNNSLLNFEDINSDVSFQSTPKMPGKSVNLLKQSLGISAAVARVPKSFSCNSTMSEENSPINGSINGNGDVNWKSNVSRSSLDDSLCGLTEAFDAKLRLKSPAQLPLPPETEGKSRLEKEGEENVWKNSTPRRGFVSLDSSERKMIRRPVSQSRTLEEVKAIAHMQELDLDSGSPWCESLRESKKQTAAYQNLMEKYRSVNIGEPRGEKMTALGHSPLRKPQNYANHFQSPPKPTKSGAHYGSMSKINGSPSSIIASPIKKQSPSPLPGKTGKSVYGSPLKTYQTVYGSPSKSYGSGSYASPGKSNYGSPIKNGAYGSAGKNVYRSTGCTSYGSPGEHSGTRLSDDYGSGTARKSEECESGMHGWNPYESRVSGSGYSGTRGSGTFGTYKGRNSDSYGSPVKHTGLLVHGSGAYGLGTRAEGMDHRKSDDFGAHKSGNFGMAAAAWSKVPSADSGNHGSSTFRQEFDISQNSHVSPIRTCRVQSQSGSYVSEDYGGGGGPSMRRSGATFGLEMHGSWGGSRDSGIAGSAIYKSPPPPPPPPCKSSRYGTSRMGTYKVEGTCNMPINGSGNKIDGSASRRSLNGLSKKYGSSSNVNSWQPSSKMGNGVRSYSHEFLDADDNDNDEDAEEVDGSCRRFMPNAVASNLPNSGRGKEAVARSRLPLPAKPSRLPVIKRK